MGRASEEGRGEGRGGLGARGGILGAKLIKKKKNPRSGWQLRNVFIFEFSLRLYKLAWSVPVGVESRVQLESASLVSWMLSPWQDSEVPLFPRQRFLEHLLCAGRCSEGGDAALDETDPPRPCRVYVLLGEPHGEAMRE